MEAWFIFGIFLLIIIYFYLFYRFTLNKMIVCVKKKYNVDGIRFIIDGNNTKFKIDHSIPCLWINDCECDELWDTLKENNTYTLHYYGIDYPLINSYYYVIRII